VALFSLIAGTAVFYYRGPLLSTLGMTTESPRQALIEVQAAAPTEPEGAAGEAEQAASGLESEAETDAVDDLTDSTESVAGEAVAEIVAADEPVPLVPGLPVEEALTSIDSIFWQEEAGETVVVLVADGLFRTEGYASLRLPGSPPRLLVKIPGVRRPFRPDRLAIDSQHVLRVRTGLHAEPDGSTLHVVADLISDRVQLLRIVPDGTELRVVFTDSIGFQELLTAADVDAFMAQKQGSAILVINSVCGCAAGQARPGVRKAIEHDSRPEQLATVFAGQDLEATAKARSYFADIPPSSPSIVLFKDGELVYFVPRHRIESRSAEAVAEDLTAAFERYFSAAPVS
jgi:putative YphP/YqiW family bacilliredoxin